MKLKKIASIGVLVIIGGWMIYGLNRIVTRPYVSNAAEEKTIEPQKEEGKTQKSKTKKENAKEEEVGLPAGSKTDWNLLLVSPTHPLEEDFSEDMFSTLDNGMLVDKRMVGSLDQLQQAATEAGFPLVIVSAYRSISYQEQIFQDYLDRWTAEGYSEKEALEKVKETSTEPGFSEHHTGLSIDIVDEEWANSYPSEMLEVSYAETVGGRWLAEHARDYGFILRYPKGKEDITKITFEPWHFRYVGVEHAKYIEAHQLSLEEYLDLLNEK